MTTYRRNAGDGLAALFKGRKISRGAAWGVMIIGALLAFEMFNFSTTEFALNDVLGELKFAGFRWATILSIAFCGIDFAGIARMFTPEQGADEPAEVWYLFGAWLLAAAMNAMLTWWGVSIAIISHSSMGAGSVVSNATLTKAVPVFVAIMVWLIRVLIIGTFSLAGDRLFSQDRNRARSTARSVSRRPQTNRATASLRPASNLPRPANTYTRPAPKPQGNYTRPEPTYQNMSFGGSKQNQQKDRYEV
ncbi:MAG: hypothetical protein WBL25_00060 [Anaerolineales bacterium]